MKINYLFSGLNKEKGFTKEQEIQLKEDIKENSTIVFIASLFNDHEKTTLNANKIVNMFQKININFKEVYIIDGTITKNNAKEIIEKSDIVFLLGGSPTNQMKSIIDYNIKSLLKNKKFILGVSAGSMNQTKKVIYKSEYEDEEPIENYEGLGFFENSIYPHLQLDNSSYMEELFEISEIIKLIALPNESFIRIKDKDIDFFGEYYIVENKKMIKGRRRKK